MSSARGDEIAVVAIGGIAGALARAAISVAVPHSDRASWPWATFVTNLAGCLVLGLLLAWIDARHEVWSRVSPRRARLARPLLATGVLGGFTTFSTFSLETYQLLDHHAALVAVAYVLASAVVGIALVATGRVAGARLVSRSSSSVRDDEVL